MTVAQFYGMLSEAAELPKTAQITPLEFEERFRPHIEAGTISSCCRCQRSSAAPMGMRWPPPRSFPKAG